MSIKLQQILKLAYGQFLACSPIGPGTQFSRRAIVFRPNAYQ